MIFICMLCSLLLVGVSSLAYVERSRRRLLSQSWSDILARLKPVDIEGIGRIATLYHQPNKGQLDISPGEMWKIVGGLEGLRRMRANARVMRDLSAFAERWNWEHGPVLSEMMRRDAMRLNKAIRSIEIALFLRFGIVKTPFGIQEAASAYFLLRGRLIGFYEATQVGLLDQLQACA